MEQAVFISKIKDLDCVTQKYSRLYYGAEFCEHLAPSCEDLDQVVRFADGRNMDFTLVTSFLTDEGLRRAQRLLGRLFQIKPHSEVVVNDWGLLGWLNREYPGFGLVLGRLLTKQKRGPQILSLKGRVPDAMVDHFRRCNADSAVLRDFLAENRVKRIELDNLLQGIRRPADALPGSLYLPFAYITTTRLCLANSCEDRTHKPYRAIVPCHQECQKHSFRLRHKQIPVDLLLKGNTQFFKNERLPDNVSDLNIDRIVFEPEMPV